MLINKVLYNVAAALCLFGVFAGLYTEHWQYPLACMIWVSIGYDDMVKMDKLKEKLNDLYRFLGRSERV